MVKFMCCELAVLCRLTTKANNHLNPVEQHKYIVCAVFGCEPGATAVQTLVCHCCCCCFGVGTNLYGKAANITGVCSDVITWPRKNLEQWESKLVLSWFAVEPSANQDQHQSSTSTRTALVWKGYACMHGVWDRYRQVRHMALLRYLGHFECHFSPVSSVLESIQKDALKKQR